MPKDITQRFFPIFLGLAVTVIICWLLTILKFVFLPLVLALFLSYLLYPMVSWLHRRKVPVLVATLLAVILSLAIVYLVGTIVLQSMVSFTDGFPRYERQMETMITEARRLSSIKLGPVEDLQSQLRGALQRMSLSSVVSSTLNSFATFLWYFTFTFVFVFYLLIGRPRLPHKIQQAFSPDRAALINDAMESIGKQVQKYLVAKTFTSIITGGLVLIILLSFGVDFPVTWAFFAFLLNFIPTLGIIIATAMPTMVAVIQFADWIMPLWVLITLSVVLTVMGNFIEPRILGESVNLSPLAALFALIFWGWMWGAAGMVIAVPLTAMIKFTLDHIDGLRPLGVMMGGED